MPRLITEDFGTAIAQGSICRNTLVFTVPDDHVAEVEAVRTALLDKTPNPRNRGKGRKLGSVRFKRRSRH